MRIIKFTCFSRNCLIQFHHYSSIASNNPNKATELPISTNPTDRFVPPCGSPKEAEIEALAAFLSQHRAIFVLTGAGISTESGIPDYRSEHVGLYARSTQKPMMFADFLSSARARQRYWARNFIAWPHFSGRSPNAGHRALRELEQLNRVPFSGGALHYETPCNI